jgi:hypothetical protein
MLFVAISILFSSACAVIARWRHPTTVPYTLPLIAFATAAVAAAIGSAITRQYAEFDPISLLFGLGTGASLAAGAYFALRAMEEGSLAVSPSLLRVPMALPILLAVFVVDDVTALSAFGIAGVGLGAASLALLVLGVPVAKSTVAAQNRLLSTIFLLILFGFFYLGLLLFAAVIMAHGNESLFLLFVFGAATATVAPLSLARDRAYEPATVALGGGLGLLLYGAFFALLAALASEPAWQAFSLVTFGHVLMTVLATGFILREPFRPVGYAGLFGLVVALALTALA